MECPSHASKAESAQKDFLHPLKSYSDREEHEQCGERSNVDDVRYRDVHSWPSIGSAPETALGGIP